MLKIVNQGNKTILGASLVCLFLCFVRPSPEQHCSRCSFSMMIKIANDGLLQANDGKMLVNDGERLVNDGEMLVNDGEMRSRCNDGERLVNDGEKSI